MSENRVSEKNFVSRRGFLTGAAVVAAGLAATSVTGCAGASSTPDYLPKSWDSESDVIVVGMGAGGLSAAVSAMQEGASAIVLEAAPEKDAGGSTRVSGDMLMIPEEAEKGIAYQSVLNAGYTVSDERMQAWVKGLMDNKPWLEDEVGYDLQQGKAASPEFPGIEGGEAIKTYYVDGVCGLSSLWIPLNDTVHEMGATIFYDARAIKLVYNPANKEVLGVQTEDGRSFKAKKGVILACGGFENNPEMIRNNFPCLGSSECLFLGSPYNKGDGITMATEVGAKLWHMNSYAGVGVALRSNSPDSGIAAIPSFMANDYIYVNGEGERFMYEERARLTRHGKLKEKGAWPLVTVPGPAFAIFGPKAFAAAPVAKAVEWMSWGTMMGGNAADTNQGMVDKGVYIKADTVEELAKKLGYNAAVLKATIDEYNAAASSNTPDAFGRGEAVHDNYIFSVSDSSAATAYSEEGKVVIEAFTRTPIEAPYYAASIAHGLLNSQGGPERNEVCQTLDAFNNPIPRLYNAGELGSIYGYMYNGGGNVSEAVATGRIAAKHCVTLDAWDAKK